VSGVARAQVIAKVLDEVGHEVTDIASAAPKDNSQKAARQAAARSIAMSNCAFRGLLFDQYRQTGDLPYCRQTLMNTSAGSRARALFDRWTAWVA
jgi:hypothetical protein